MGPSLACWSRCDDAWPARQAALIAEWPANAVPWVIFDNTASGAATADALACRDGGCVAQSPLMISARFFSYSDFVSRPLS